MSLRQFLATNRDAEADRSSQENDRPPSYTSTSNVTTAPAHILPGRDSLTETLGLAETSEIVATPSPDYIYYRIYAEDGAIPSKTPVAPGYPFLGRIKARSLPPPRNAKAVKCRIVKVENIKDGERTSLFLTPSSQSPMGDADKVTVLNGTGSGSMPQEPLALVAKMSDSERITLESDGRGGLASAAEVDTMHPEIRYVYYLLYADGDEMPSKVAFDEAEPSLGRIRADSIAPPCSSSSIKRCISRVERNLALAHADLFENTSCDTPLEEGQISLLRTDGPGLSPNEPMAIVEVKKSPDPLPMASISDGKYLIKNRATDHYWTLLDQSQYSWDRKVYFYTTQMEVAKRSDEKQWNISADTNGNISIRSVCAPSWWVGAEITWSKVPVPWRLIPADSESYYLTTDMNCGSQNPRVPVPEREGGFGHYGSIATLKEGDQWQMWEFIRI